MKSGKRLDSAVFQLTPTRTRYDLVIIANGKTEKMGSGLLNPFLAHLKTAQDQIAKGGYSIKLEPGSGSDAAWFTKGTVERFIRFVSTPEVLERVNTIEAEILQIEEAIVIQGNENMGLTVQVEDHQKKVEDHPAKSMLMIEGSRPVLDADAEKAIVLYKPEAHPPESNGSTTHEEHSRVQLLRVLETRRTVLQKEQGMAFARSVAAGFDMDHIPYLISFAECFGASRLLDACLRFIDLWKVKHETGQWMEIEASEAMSTRSDFSSMNIGTMVASETGKQNESREKSELGIECNGNANVADANSGSIRDKRPPMDAQVPPGQQDYNPAHFQHPMFSQWPIHSPPGAPPVFQAYPMQGIPYYNYPPGGPYFQPPYPPMEDPRFNTPQRMGVKRHSMDSKDGSTELDTWEAGVSNKRSQDGSELENEGSHGQQSRRKSRRSGKKQSGMVVIRNINYITSKKQDASGSESQSASDSETDEEAEDLEGNASEKKHKNSVRSSRSEEKRAKSAETWNSYDNGGTVYGQETDGGHWHAFQNCLLRDNDKKSHGMDQDMFSGEKEAQVTRRTNATGPDPLVPNGRDLGQVQEERTTEFDDVNGKFTRMLKTSDDGLVISQGEFLKESRDRQLDVNYREIAGGRGRYKREAGDDFMIYRQETESSFMRSQSDPLNANKFENTAKNLEGSSSYNARDESFIVPLRQDNPGTHGRNTIDMDTELPSGSQKTEDSSKRIRSQLSYEPDDLSMMPERGAERESVGFDPALDYEMQVHAVEAQGRNKKDAVTSVSEETKQLNKEKKLKGTQGSSERKRAEASMRKGKPSKLTPPNDAQARADRLRAFKADLQKMKKEKDEEDRKRLEDLKRERQKRIAARGGSTLAQPTLPSQMKPRQPIKLSPSSHKGSKFTDSEPGPLSPLQRLPIRTASVGSGDSLKIAKPSKLSNSGRLAGHGLSRSVSSLPELKKKNDGLTPDPKIATRQIQRLSEPRTSKTNHVSSAKLQKSDPSPKPRVSDGPEIKKITAIMSLDKTKAATLPELKIKTPRVSSNINQNKPMQNELMHKSNGSRSSITAESSKVKRSFAHTSHDNNVDENPVIEKTVVMLERETPPVPVVHEIEERTETRKGLYTADNKLGDKTQVVSDYAAIHAKASSLTSAETVRDASECHVGKLHNYHQADLVSADYAGEELSKISTLSIAEKPYQAPYARVSSLEEPCTTNSEFTKATKRSSETQAADGETARANLSDFTAPSSIEQILESSEKPQGKESSKGFRRFLKLGRKNHSSSTDQRNVESDKFSTDGSLVDDHAVDPAASDEVHTLKNLISQSETPTGSTPQKASRPFSLLSPFRSKTSEKKQSA